MTEQVKFPGTEFEAPKTILIEVEEKDNGSKVFHVNQSCMESEIGEFIEYHRADTVTPNDLLEKMLVEAYEAGFCRAAYHNQCSSSLARKKAIDEIRSRYASSDSD